MTLIARPLANTSPILFSDILITDTVVEKPLILPTFGVDITNYLAKDSLRFPADLNQKIYIVKENVCIAFSGFVTEISDLLKELKDFVRYFDYVGEKEIRTFFNKHYSIKRRFRRSSCLLMLIEKEDDKSILCKEFIVGKWKNDSNDLFLETQASGSGSLDYLFQSNQELEFYSSFEDLTINQGIAKNLSFLAQMLAVERASLYPIKNHWGAGYELVVYNGSSFIKFDEIAYIINEGTFTEYGDIQLPFPAVIMYYKYISDILFITAINLLNHHLVIEGDYLLMTSSDVQVHIHRVDSFLSDMSNAETDLKNASFETHRVAFGYVLKTPDTGFLSPSFTTYSKDLKVRYSPDEGVQITMKIDINEMIRQKSKQVFDKKWAKPNRHS